MEDSRKNKHHCRRKRKSEKVAVQEAEKEGNRDKTYSHRTDPNRFPVSSRVCSSDRQNFLTDCCSSGTEIQNCSQFIEHEPAVIWASPQASPNSSHEQNVKMIDLITPPQEKCVPKKKPVGKPTRKLPGAASPSFLTKLLDLSEQYKYSEVVVTEERQLEDNHLCDDDIVPCGSSAESIKRYTVQKQGPESNTFLIKDEFGMLLEDDDDDVIIKCTQEMEGTINDSGCKNFERPNVSIPSHNVPRKSKVAQPDDIKASSKHVAKLTKVPAKLPSGKKKNNPEQSPLGKPTKARSLGSAKYYKDGVFLGYGSRKSPRTKKNIFASLNSVNHQEICNDSFESALQTLADEDYSFLEMSAGKDLDRPAEFSNKGSSKKCNANDNFTEQTAVTKTKTRQSEERSERTNIKSRAENPKKCSSDNHSTHLSVNVDTFFETAALEDDMVNETELVNVLEIVESQAVSSSPPFRCTPEEILRKRIEAKQKLAKKKLNAKNKTCLASVVKPKR